MLVGKVEKPPCWTLISGTSHLIFMGKKLLAMLKAAYAGSVIHV